jgi:hypothetical protein
MQDGFHPSRAAIKSVAPAEAGAQPATQSEYANRQNQEVMLTGLGPSLRWGDEYFEISGNPN